MAPLPTTEGRERGTDRSEAHRKRRLASAFPTRTTHESAEVMAVIPSCSAEKRTENAMGSRLGRRRAGPRRHAIGRDGGTRLTRQSASWELLRQRPGTGRGVPLRGDGVII